RASGSVGANEHIRLVFIPANHTFADALLVTDSAVIRLGRGGTVRYSSQESDVNLQPLPRGTSRGGMLIVRPKGRPPDTLYQELSAREGFALANAWAAWQRSQKR